MTTCRAVRFPKTKICAADFRHPIRLVRRELQTPRPGETAASLGYTQLASKRAALRRPSLSQPFDGVDINDRPTHVWRVRYDSALATTVEFSNHFIEYKGRYLRVTGIDPDQDDNRYIIIQSTERGKTAQAAAGA